MDFYKYTQFLKRGSVWLLFCGMSFLMPSAAAASPESGLGTSDETQSLVTPSGLVPFAGYEDRLRQSPEWERMSPKEREHAIQKIQNLRQRFKRNQQEIEAQYKHLLEKNKKPRESLMQKRRRTQQYKATDHWTQFQALPIKKRLEMEKTLGLNRVPPSQKRKKFSQHLERLPYSKKQKVLQDIEGKAR